MSEAAWDARVTELDAVLAACAFPDATVRDSSNRSNRDWPWWSVDVVQRREDYPDTQRATAIVRLNATRDVQPGDYDARWRGEVWSGSNTNSLDRHGNWPLPWRDVPTPEQLQAVIADLLDHAWLAIERG